MRHFSIEQLQRAINYMQGVAEARIKAALIAGPPVFMSEDSVASFYAERDWETLEDLDPSDYASDCFPAYDWCIDALFERVRDININALRKDMRQC